MNAPKSRRAVVCPYCGKDAELLTGEQVYGSSLYRDKLLWVCKPCDARVGCHAGGDTPLGTLANEELRRARMLAHAAFDPLWRGNAAAMRRREAYEWLAGELDVPVNDCHIGNFDKETCARVVAAVAARAK